MALTRKQILDCDDEKIEEVPVPEWNGSVYVGRMSAQVRDDLEQDMLILRQNKKKSENIRARIVAATACDKSGKRLFSSADVKALGEKAAKPIDRLFDAAQRINGLSEVEIEGMEKNSC